MTEKKLLTLKKFFQNYQKKLKKLLKNLILSLKIIKAIKPINKREAMFEQWFMCSNLLCLTILWSSKLLRKFGLVKREKLLSLLKMKMVKHYPNNIFKMLQNKTLIFTHNYWTFRMMMKISKWLLLITITIW